METEGSDEIVYKYILYEPSSYMLSFDALPVDNYYNGLIINVSNHGENYSSIVSGFQGKDRKIPAHSLPEHLDESYHYELFENVKGVMPSALTLSNDSSNIINYYVGWNLATIDNDGFVKEISTIETYNSRTKAITLKEAITTAEFTKYKLYFNSEN